MYISAVNLFGGWATPYLGRSSARQEQWRQRQAQSLGRLQVDDQGERVCPLHWQVGLPAS